MIIVKLSLTWLRDNSDCLCDIISDRPGHSEARDVFFGKPNSLRAHVISGQLILEGFNPTSSFKDALTLIFIAGFMIS